MTPLDVVANFNFAMSVAGTGKTVLASYTTRTCYSSGPMSSLIVMQPQELQHLQRLLSIELQKRYASAIIANTRVAGIVLKVRIAVKNAVITFVVTFCSAVIACFKLVHDASATDYEEKNRRDVQ